MTRDAAGREGREPTKAKVFISYSRKDMAFTDRLEAGLKARGFEPLVDRTGIYVFEEWWQRIEALILRADTVVFVLSPDSVASAIALKEVDSRLRSTSALRRSSAAISSTRPCWSLSWRIRKSAQKWSGAGSLVRCRHRATVQSMIHLLILAVHLLATIAKLVRPGGVRVVVADPCC
jgi:hypothetical protein